jgi:GGDEF domain-containing protein
MSQPVGQATTDALTKIANRRAFDLFSCVNAAGRLTKKRVCA